MFEFDSGIDFVLLISYGHPLCSDSIRDQIPWIMERTLLFGTGSTLIFIRLGSSETLRCEGLSGVEEDVELYAPVS